MAEITTTLTFDVELTDIRRGSQLVSQEQVDYFLGVLKDWLASEFDDVHIRNVQYKNFVMEK